MFKVEIFTAFGPFIAVTPDDVTSALDALDFVKSQAADQGGAIPLDDGSLLRVRTLDHILATRAFKAYEEKPDPWDEAAREEAPPKTPATADSIGHVYTWTALVKYAGMDHTATIMQTWDNKGRAYFQLYTINGKAANDMISEEGQPRFLTVWLDQQPSKPDAYTLVVPHGTISDHEEAEAYLKDFVAENQGEYKPKEKTGKAWPGWADDRGAR